VQFVPAEARVLRARGGDGQVDLAIGEELGDLVAGGLTKVELHLGCGGAERAQTVGNQPAGKRMQERQSHRSAVGIAQGGNAIRRGLDFADAAARMLEHDLSVGVQMQPAVDPIEQGRAGLSLEPSQRPRQRGLRDVEFGGRFGHVLGLGQHHEPTQLVHIHRQHDTSAALTWCSSVNSCMITCGETARRACALGRRSSESSRRSPVASRPAARRPCKDQSGGRRRARS